MVFVPFICMMGLVAIISLFGFYSLVDRVRFGALIGGRTNLWSLDCVKVTHELYAASTLHLNLRDMQLTLKGRHKIFPKSFIHKLMTYLIVWIEAL